MSSNSKPKVVCLPKSNMKLHRRKILVVALAGKKFAQRGVHATLDI